MIYRTKQGDTWDLIALKVYPKIGGEKLMDVLLEHNPDHIHTVIFSANVILNIPDRIDPFGFQLHGCLLSDSVKNADIAVNDQVHEIVRP